MSHVLLYIIHFLRGEDISLLFYLPRNSQLCTLHCRCSIAKSCLTLCEPVDCNTWSFSVLHYFMLKLTSVEPVMQSNHPIFCCSLLLLDLNLSQHQGVFQWVGSLHHVTKVLELQLQMLRSRNRGPFRNRKQHIGFLKIKRSLTFSISPANEHSGLISFRIDWFDLFAVHSSILCSRCLLLSE